MAYSGLVSPGAIRPMLARQFLPNAHRTTTIAVTVFVMLGSLGVQRRRDAFGFPNAAMPMTTAAIV